MGKMRPFWFSVWLALWCGFAAPVCAQNSFAVQIAAVQSRAEAEALVNGLRARRVSAYWVKAEVPDKGIYYRVRVGGQFANGRSATDFGQKLKETGLINEYAVFKYDAPTAPLDEHKADKTATRATVKTPAAEQPVPKRETIPAAPPTDYLISGRPLPVSEMETTRTSNKPPSAPPSQPAVLSRTEPPSVVAGKAKAKHSDEIELDDFVEFTKVLRGTVETQAGRVQVSLQNINKRYRFRGKVNVTFAENERESPQQPMQIEIAPGQEQTFEVAHSMGRGGSYILKVYDEQNTLQLMQSGGLDPSANHQVIAENRQPKPAPPSPAPVSPTGDVPAQPPLEVTEPDESSGSNGARAPNDPNGKAEESKKSSAPGDVEIIVRKLMETSENVTLEFEILAQQPLGMITVALRTASVNDAKQAIMTTKQGRMPFLVPASDMSGGFSYELKDEQGRLLAAGQKSFQQLRRD